MTYPATIADADRLRAARERVEAIVLAIGGGGELYDPYDDVTLTMQDLRTLLAATAPHPGTGQTPAELLDAAQRDAARYRADRDDALDTLGQIRGEVLYPGIHDQRRVERFKLAWHKADEEGRLGNRTIEGLDAVLAPLYVILDERGVQ